MLTARSRIILLSLLLVFAIVLGMATYAAAKFKRPFKDNAPKQTVEIKQGDSARDIAATLEKEGIISNDKLFVYYLFLAKASHSLQAGEYELSASMTIPEIVKTLSHGEVVPNEIRVRIGEGWRLSQIAAEVQNAGLGSEEDFYALAGSPPHKGGQAASASVISNYDFLRSMPKSASLEGYLFPDTYFISREGGIEELVHKALRNFEAKAVPAIQNSSQVGEVAVHELVTVASLIEGEVGRNVSGRKLTQAEIEEIEQERHLVASVFYNRLDIGMALESDATIGYATGKPRRQATFADLEVQSPYNTYRNRGLPPGPINNPSLAALKAALSPADTDYLFFLSAPDGKAYFAKTLQEHNENRTKYLPLR